MNGNNFFIDTNIAVYLLSGNKVIAEILQGSQLYISFITQLELLAYKKLSQKESQLIHEFLSECIIIDINDEIKKLAIEVRQKHSLKLSDCIIVATSIYLNCPLFTADKGLKKISKLNLILFEE